MLKSPTKCLWSWESDRRSTFLLQSACTSMCRHVYDWNIVDCDVKQQIYLTSLYYLREQNNTKQLLSYTSYYIITFQSKNDGRLHLDTNDWIALNFISQQYKSTLSVNHNLIYRLSQSIQHNRKSTSCLVWITSYQNKSYQKIIVESALDRCSYQLSE